VELLESAVERAEAFREWARSRYRREAIELSLLIARRVLMHEIKLNPGILLEIMDELLRNEESPVLQEIRVAPEQRAEVVEGLEVLMKYAPEGASPRVLADPEVEAGFVLITDHGGIDARLETQLSRIGDQLGRGIRDEE